MSHRIAQFADRAHIDRQKLARVNSAVIFGLVSGGLLACAGGAVLYDLGRLFSAW